MSLTPTKKTTVLPEGLARTLRPWLLLALVCGGFSLHPDFARTFWTREYLPNLLQQAATNVILATGLTFVILTGGIDLSVGSVMALCGVALGLTVTEGPPPFLALLMAVPFGAIAATLVGRVASCRWKVEGYGPQGEGGLAGERAGRRGWVRPEVVTGAASSLAAVVATALGGFLILQLTRGGIRLEGAILAALAVGLGCGLINGAVVSFGKVPSFVVTLGMLTAARGLTVYATDGNSVSGLPARLGSLGQGAPLVLIALVVVVLAAVLQARTRPGRMVQAIGANEEAARLSGVNILGYKTLAYLLSGLGAGIAAVVLTAKFQVADTGAGMGAELNAIAAVVLGGTSLSGGRGSIVGSLVGALTIAVLNAGLVLVGVQDTLQGVVVGIVIVLAVMVDRLRKS